MRIDKKIERIKRLGYKVVPWGKNIKATKGKEVLIGSVNYVHKMIFRY